MVEDMYIRSSTISSGNQIQAKVLTAGADEDCKAAPSGSRGGVQFSGSRQWRSCRTMSMCSSTRSRSSISLTWWDHERHPCRASLFLLLHPEMKEKLWGGHLWNPSYCAVTGVHRSRVWRNISGARRKGSWGGKGRPGRGIWKGSRDSCLIQGKMPDADLA